jgi:hypothetical protein
LAAGIGLQTEKARPTAFTTGALFYRDLGSLAAAILTGGACGGRQAVAAYMRQGKFRACLDVELATSQILRVAAISRGTRLI